ncbi:MAG: nucleotide sugar dehydrogenase [Nitrososphaerota archaeon]|nr:nucleotide sugar dehydrogenase [Nitrososphaerota archaeon]
MARSSIRRVSVVGLGKLGLTLAAVLADSGYEVRGIELDGSKVDAVNEGRSPLYEPGLDELVRKNHARLSASTSFEGQVAGTEATFVVVPTPSLESGAFSTDLVEKAMKSVGRELAKKKGYHLVVLTSTVGPGSMDGVVKPALEKASGRRVGAGLGLCYNPEFIALGDVIKGLRSPDFLLIGESDRKAGDALESIQKVVCTNSPPVERMEFVNAELAKIAVNSFVTMKMSFANTLAEISERLPGGNVDKVTSAVGRDRRIGGAYLRGATGFGGTCLAEGTLVQTAEGLKAIEEILEGEKVMGHDGRFHTVNRTFSRQYEGKVVTIVPEGNHPVTLTPEHPVLSSPRVTDEKMRYLDTPERTGGDGYWRSGHLLRSMTSLKLLPYSWRRAEDVKRGDLMVYPVPLFPEVPIPILNLSAYQKKKRRSGIPPRFLLSPDVCRLIGYYLAEGSTWKKQIVFRLHKRQTHLVEDLQKIIGSLGYQASVKKTSENGIAVVFTCSSLARFLRAIFGGRASSKKIPSDWLGLPDEFRLELMRGVMYGDGSSSGSGYTFGVTSRELANQVYLTLLSFGIASTYQVHSRYAGKDGVSHREAYFVRVRHPGEAEKLQKLLPLLPVAKRKTVNERSVWIEDGYLHFHVRHKVESQYNGKVYNLEVDQANSYCTLGASLHNCFPRDNVAFAHYAAAVGAQALIAEATHKVNLSQPGRLIALLKERGLTAKTKVGVLGLSFKPNTNVVEQSQALTLARRLAEGGYDVAVYDPAALEAARVVLKGSVSYAKSAQDLVRGAELVVLATPWPEFGAIPARLFAGKAVFDCWRLLGEGVRKVSRYSSIGTP